MKKIYTVCLMLIALTASSISLLAQTSNSALPNLLVTISADLTSDNCVAISWTTRQQLSTDHFTVEKSHDCLGWSVISTVKVIDNAASPTIYNELDRVPQKGSNFYRIRFINTDGTTNFTETKMVYLNPFGKISFYPNPAVTAMTVTLAKIPSSGWKLSIINNAGRVVAQKNYNRYTTSVNLPVNTFPGGNYIMEISDGDARWVNKFIINHK